MRRTGFGVQLDYDDVPPGELRLSPDGKRAAAWWVGRTREDRYDEDTVYEVAVWDVASKALLESYTRIHAVNHESGQERGKPLREVRFDPAGRLLLVMGDGSVEPAERELDPEPPWKKRKPGDPLPPLRAP